MFERIEGERQSPENKRMLLGCCYRRAWSLALKLTIPPRSPFGWMS